MSLSFSSKLRSTLGYALWVPAAFIGAQIVTLFLFRAINALVPVFTSVDDAVYATIFAATSYSMALLITIGLPYFIGHRQTSRETLGLQRLLGWSDIGIGLLALLPYYIFAGVLLWAATQLFPALDTTQAQAIAYKNLSQQYEYLAAFIALVILAPFAEEALFRGYFFGKIQTVIGKWWAVLVVTAVFALLHLPGEVTQQGLTLQWAVMIDILGLGLVLGALRVFTGSIWAGVLLHMFKNMIAFYFLFIYRG